MAGSWVPCGSPGSGFSLANLPFGIVTTPAIGSPHVAVAIGDSILDLQVLSSHRSCTEVAPAIAALKDVFCQPSLNAFAALGRPVHREVRRGIQGLLSADTAHPEFLRHDEILRKRTLIPQRDVEMHLPMMIGDYTDFYAGYHHAYACGLIFRGPQNALQPNYTHMPIAYHGRSSSVVVSGTPVHRPVGQVLLDPDAEPKQPTTGPSRRLDIELELGCLIARPSEMGLAIRVEEAEEYIFGYVLLNDWSARDIQKWEAVPLGPFSSKNFATTIGSWVVLADALEPFRTAGVQNGTEPQGYLRDCRADNVFDIRLQVDLTTPEGETTTISRTSAENLLWSFPQMIAHHTLGGCPMRTGDLLGSGTISGRGPSERGSLLEMTEGGTKDILLSTKEARRFLKDGDSITFRGFCGDGERQIGFGACTGRIYSPRQR